MAFKTLAIRKLSMQEERIQKALYAAMLSNMLMTEKRLITQQNLGETAVSEFMTKAHLKHGKP